MEQNPIEKSWMTDLNMGVHHCVLPIMEMRLLSRNLYDAHKMLCQGKHLYLEEYTVESILGLEAIPYHRRAILSGKSEIW